MQTIREQMLKIQTKLAVKSEFPSNFCPINEQRIAVKNPIPIPTECRYCGGAVRVAENKIIYRKNYGKWPWVYYCGSCYAYVGMHPYTDIPLGTLANKELSALRVWAKTPFNQIWKSNIMTRRQAYSWLASEMGRSVDECHFGWFDEDDCRLAHGICQDYLGGEGFLF